MPHCSTAVGPLLFTPEHPLKPLQATSKLPNMAKKNGYRTDASLLSALHACCNTAHVRRHGILSSLTNGRSDQEINPLHGWLSISMNLEWKGHAHFSVISQCNLMLSPLSQSQESKACGLRNSLPPQTVHLLLPPHKVHVSTPYFHPLPPGKVHSSLFSFTSLLTSTPAA